mmetsp:Transcript_30826/g.88342  ORF Transcript_30826/g.88342 Transcript_30826/m.88342 type:complete len:580 (-) Transcript_30826:48-1787(-)
MRHGLNPLLLAPLATLAAGLRLGSGGVEPEFSYYWPSARGRVNSYGKTNFEGPTDLAGSLAWEWHHPRNRFQTMTLGTLIDDKLSIYLAADDSIRKFNSNGDLLWKWTPPGTILTMPCLYQGALYGTTVTGHAYAVSMLTGKEFWTKRIAFRNADSGVVQALQGIVVLAANAEEPQYANTVVVGLNATTGKTIWEFKPDAPVWNFMALFVGENKRHTFVFQDMEGRAYRNYLATGELKWKNGGRNGTWTDGSVMYGNRMVYTVTLFGCCCGPCTGKEQGMAEKTLGTLSAHRLLDGSLAWKQKVWRPPNVIPAVGRLSETGREVVVMPIGMQCGPLSPSDVNVYDASTGDQLWHISAGRNPHLMCAGELEGLEYRRAHGVREHCNPPPWSAPTIDSKGTIFIGNQDGNFYALKEAHGIGKVVSQLDAGAAFTSPGSAHAPGMVAITSCDGLYVFRKQLPKGDPLPPPPTTLLAAQIEEDPSPVAAFTNKANVLQLTREAAPDASEVRSGRTGPASREQQLRAEREELERMRKLRLASRAGRITLHEKVPDDTETGDDSGLPDVVVHPKVYTQRKSARRP